MPHPNAERVQAALAERGAEAQVVELDASARTAVEAANALGTTVAQIAKSLVFLAGDAPVLVIASGVNRVDTRKVAARVGAPVRQAKAEQVRQFTGFPIGGVAPVGHATPLRTLLDRDLFQYADLWAAAGTPHAVFHTTPDELQRITGAEVVDVREEPDAASDAHSDAHSDTQG